jgi:uncharacterized LabA/DUF88 family protein
MGVTLGAGSGSSPRPIKRIMAFIDGGYLRRLCKDNCNMDCIGFDVLNHVLTEKFNSIKPNPFRAYIIRIYFYDAIVDNKNSEYDAQKRYFDSIVDKYPYYTVKLGKVVESENKVPKQKGVDILLSVDALTKAYLDQYDVGIFVMGDADFKPLIEAIKDTGKQTMCIYYPQNTAEELTRTFDIREPLSLHDIKTLTTHLT